MNIVDQGNGCCGGSFDKTNISLIGLSTFSFPLWLISINIYFFLWITLQSKSKTAQFFKVLIISNTKLINDKNIYSKFKCILAGKVFNFSPRIAGYIFKSFNFIIIMLLWLIITSILVGVKCLLT